MSLLNLNTELAQGLRVGRIKESQVDTQPQVGDVSQGTIGWHCPGRLQEPQGAMNSIADGGRVFIHKQLSQVSLEPNDLGYEGSEVINQLVFGTPKSHLVTDLIKITSSPAALSLHASYRQPRTLSRVEHLLQLIANHPKRWKVQHHRCAQPRPNIGRATGQVPELAIVREGEPRLEELIQAERPL